MIQKSGKEPTQQIKLSYETCMLLSSDDHDSCGNGIRSSYSMVTDVHSEVERVWSSESSIFPIKYLTDYLLSRVR